MVKTYLYSIVVYMIIIWCSGYLCKENIKKNGWNKPVETDMNPLLVLLAVSAIPIIRLVFVGFIFYMACYTLEHFEAWKAKIDKECEELNSDNVNFTFTYEEDE